MKRQRIKEAVEIWGGEVVREAILMTEVSDPDGAWVLFQDEGLEAMKSWSPDWSQNRFSS